MENKKPRVKRGFLLLALSKRPDLSIHSIAARASRVPKDSRLKRILGDVVILAPRLREKFTVAKKMR